MSDQKLKFMAAVNFDRATLLMSVSKLYDERKALQARLDAATDLAKHYRTENKAVLARLDNAEKLIDKWTGMNTTSPWYANDLTGALKETGQ